MLPTQRCCENVSSFEPWKKKADFNVRQYSCWHHLWCKNPVYNLKYLWSQLQFFLDASSQNDLLKKHNSDFICCHSSCLTKCQLYELYIFSTKLCPSFGSWHLLYLLLEMLYTQLFLFSVLFCFFLFASASSGVSSNVILTERPFLVTLCKLGLPPPSPL